MNERILGTLGSNQIKSILFVCGKRVDSNPGRQLVATWDRAGHLIWSELSIPLFTLDWVLLLMLVLGFMGCSHFEGRAGSDRVAFSTVDQSDIRGSSRIIVIRRELPHTRDASLAAKPVA